jgi:hypothetical protein
MRIDEQKTFDLMKNDRDRLSNEVDRLKLENDGLRKLVINYKHDLFNSESVNSDMKNISVLSLAVSFIISMFFGVLAFFFLAPGSGFDAMLAIIIGVWWFASFGYYFVWRMDVKANVHK